MVGFQPMSNDPWAAFRVQQQQPADPWAAFREPTPVEATTQQQPRSTAESVGLGARSAAQGLASGIPGMLYDAAAVLPNLATRGINAVAGTQIPQIAPARQQVAGVADALGLPTPRDRRERIQGGAIEFGAGALSSVALGRAVSSVPGIVGAIGRVLRAQPAVQVASSAIGGAVGEATDNPVLGAAASVVAPLAMNVGAAGLRAAVSPAGRVDPVRAGLVAGAAREGIPLSSGQVTGSRTQQFVESAFESLPLTAGRAQMQTQAQQEAFNRAVLSRAGISASRATSEVLTRAQGALSNEYKTLTARNNMGRTPEFAQAMDDLGASIQTMTDDAAKVTKGYLKQIIERVNPQGVMPGRAWQNLDARIGEQARASSNPEVRTALYQLQNAMRDGMGASIKASGNGADWDRWVDLRGRYSAFITVRDVMNRAGANIGVGHISPLALRGELAGRNAYAMGRGDLAELARIGQTLLRPTPTSGTAERTAAMNLIQGGVGASSAGLLATGIALGDPLTAASAAAPVVLPPIAQRLYNMPAVQAYLRNQALTGMPNPVSREALGAVATTQAGRLATDPNRPR